MQWRLRKTVGSDVATSTPQVMKSDSIRARSCHLLIGDGGVLWVASLFVLWKTRLVRQSSSNSSSLLAACAAINCGPSCGKGNMTFDPVSSGNSCHVPPFNTFPWFPSWLSSVLASGQPVPYGRSNLYFPNFQGCWNHECLPNLKRPKEPKSYHRRKAKHLETVSSFQAYHHQKCRSHSLAP